MNYVWQVPVASPPRLLMMGISVHQPLRDWDRYQLPGFWCLHFYRYDGELRIDGESFAIRPGSCSVTPPGALLEYAYGHTPSIHAVVHFELDGAASTSEQVELPAMRALGEQFDALAALCEEAIPWLASEPRRASARIWDLLWQLGNIPPDASESGPAPATVERARRYIEMRLASNQLRVEHVATHAGLSHNHFIRVFAAATGMTPAAYIRRRRVERAHHLLKRSTLPVKAIAAQCGLGDLQAFNKAVRREMGVSPRTLRGALTARDN